MTQTKSVLKDSKDRSKHYVIYKSGDHYCVRKCRMKKQKLTQGKVVARALTLQGARGLMHYKFPGLALSNINLDDTSIIEAWA